MRQHFTPVGVAVLPTPEDSNGWCGCGEGTFAPSLLLGLHLGAAAVETVEEMWGDQRWGGGRERAEGVGGQTPLYVPPEDEGLCLPPRFTALTEKLVKGPLPREQVLAGQCEVPGVK